MKSNNMFREQVNSVTSWFSSWSECEQTVALYSLLKQVPPLQCRFLVEMLQQRLRDNKEVIKQEEEANDPGFIGKLGNEPKEHAISELLCHLPLLHSGNIQAKTEYLKIIPIILSHSIDKGVFIEESRQLLSYSLIHPAITSDERSKFNMWLGHLDERFSNYHSPNQVQGQISEGQGQCYSQSQIRDNGISQRTHMTLTKAHSIGSGRLNGCWNVNNANMYHSSDSVNNMNGIEGQGHGDGNVYGSRPHVNHPAAGTSSGHMPLQPTRSAPANFTAVQPPPSNNSPNQPVTHHAPLRRMPSFKPSTSPANLPPSDASVSDWLKSNDAHLINGPGRPCSGLSDHAPLSPQSSTASSGSGSDTHPDDIPPQSIRNTFMEEKSGMRDVPLWLKGLRLHKYASLFQQMTYEEMLNLNENWLTQQAVTKGARNKIVISIKKLLERQDLLRSLEKDITEGGSIKNCICEMKAMLNSPIKAFVKQGTEPPVGSPSSPGVDTSDSIQEGDIPGQFTRLMAKVCTQLLTSTYDDEGLNMYLQLIDKCINHEAFSQKQKKLLETWKQQARKIWQPAPYKYGFDKKPRSNWGNTFPIGPTYNSRPIQRAGLRTSPKQVTSSGAQWCFGAKRSVVGGTMSSGHLPVQRNSSHNAMLYNHPGLIEQPAKQPVSRTQSAPIRNQAVGYGAPAPENTATDTEINARLDSLCRSVTECALGGQDGSEKGSGF